MFLGSHTMLGKNEEAPGCTLAGSTLHPVADPFTQAVDQRLFN